MHSKIMEVGELNSTESTTQDLSLNATLTLPPDMVFGDAQIISIAAYTPLFLISATLNLRVLGNLLRVKERSGLSRLNQLLLHLVLADLSVSPIVDHQMSTLGSDKNYVTLFCPQFDPGVEKCLISSPSLDDVISLPPFLSTINITA